MVINRDQGREQEFKAPESEANYFQSSPGLSGARGLAIIAFPQPLDSHMVSTVHLGGLKALFHSFLVDDTRQVTKLLTYVSNPANWGQFHPSHGAF